MEKFEKHKEQAKDYEFENESGVFRMRESEEGEVTIELENKEGDVFILNDLLPDGWKIADLRSRTVTKYGEKEIWVNMHNIKHEGWKYLISILHEIGHASVFEEAEKIEERNPSVVKEELLEKEFIGIINHEERKQLEKITSKNERDSWAYAIKNLRNILEDLNMRMEEGFGSNRSVREYVHEFLSDYKGMGKEVIKKLNIPEKEKEELLEEISKLYTNHEQSEE